MAAVFLEGKAIAESIRASVREEIDRLEKKYNRRPRLVALQIGENPSSSVYIKAQKKLSEELHIDYELKTMPDDSSQEDALRLIKQLNADDGTTAVILQLPVPKNIDPKRLVDAIRPDKDAEGMHPYNLGKIVSGNYDIGPCTALAAMELIQHAKIDLYGKEAVVVGHSEIVGKPIAMLLLNKFATTTVCHIATGERGILAEHVNRAEVLVVAVGKAGVVKGDWVKSGAVVIDIGINKTGDKIVGDVEFDKAKERAAFITPVPGGVGPLTTTMLMRNVSKLFKRQVSA